MLFPQHETLKPRKKQVDVLVPQNQNLVVHATSSTASQQENDLEQTQKLAKIHQDRPAAAAAGGQQQLSASTSSSSSSSSSSSQLPTLATSTTTPRQTSGTPAPDAGRLLVNHNHLPARPRNGNTKNKQPNSINEAGNMMIVERVHRMQERNVDLEKMHRMDSILNSPKIAGERARIIAEWTALAARIPYGARSFADLKPVNATPSTKNKKKKANNTSTLTTPSTATTSSSSSSTRPTPQKETLLPPLGGGSSPSAEVDNARPQPTAAASTSTRTGGNKRNKARSKSVTAARLFGHNPPGYKAARLTRTKHIAFFTLDVRRGAFRHRHQSIPPFFEVEKHTKEFLPDQTQDVNDLKNYDDKMWTERISCHSENDIDDLKQVGGVVDLNAPLPLPEDFSNIQMKRNE
ncbi:unnamed protein product [Amoebophrya sp. A120]|nr:unnamed protein product [Amoebophrya sp. A120]|eukprot:GSA120T00001434001.1